MAPKRIPKSMSFCTAALACLQRNLLCHCPEFIENGVILTKCFGVGVSCRNLYYLVVYLYVNGSGSITSVGEERANLSTVVYL